MATDRRPSRGTIAGLPAIGPPKGQRDRMRLFGQFVGDWSIVDRAVPGSRDPAEQRTGEAHFNWILAGRAIQDVWGPLDAKTGRLDPVGTTVRYFDPAIDAWRSTWICPARPEVRRFIGRERGAEIVLQEEPRGLRTERWIFSEIRRESFRWRAVRRARVGGPWRVIEEMRLVRRAR
jgi:hypothetical protein